MSRLMSVAYTEQQVLDRTKWVTRRAGWWEDKRGRRLAVPGDTLTLCRKVMGRRKGEPLVRLVDVQLVEIWREPLRALLDPDLYRYPDYGRSEVTLEGFPDLTPSEFVQRYFVDAQHMTLSDQVTRIRWRYLDAPTTTQAAPGRRDGESA